MRFEDTLQILSAFEREGARYALVGSMGMAAHGIARATMDVDIFIDPHPSNVARIRRALMSIFDDPAIEQIVSEELAGPYPVIRYGPPESDFVIDLIARLGDAFSFDDIESEQQTSDGITFRVATPAMLYRMKRDTMRPRDRLDAEELREAFKLESDQR